MKNLRRSENLHIVFWLLKDASWASGFKTGGILMVLPTVYLAFYILIKNWENVSERFHNMAVVLWIIANSTWMIGEFFGIDEHPPYMRKLALIPFTIGVIILAVYYLFLYKKYEAIADGIE